LIAEMQFCMHLQADPISFQGSKAWIPKSSPNDDPGTKKGQPNLGNQDKQENTQKLSLVPLRQHFYSGEVSLRLRVPEDGEPADGNIEMHLPELDYLHFRDRRPSVESATFWRRCSQCLEAEKYD
jgi:hypothetical protein